MRFFTIKMNDQRKYILLYCSILFFSSILFGSYLYFNTSDWLHIYATKLFFINGIDYTDYYDLYIISTSLFIVLSIICSTSFIGVFMNGFIIYTKGIQIIFSLLYVFLTFDISFSIFILQILPQLVLEILLIYVIAIICSKLSINTFLITFILKDNFKKSKIINYLLDYIILILILLFFSMSFRVYIIG